MNRGDAPNRGVRDPDAPWRANLAALEARNPDLAQRMRDLAPPGEDAVVEAARNGAPTLRARMPNGHVASLHSRNDPGQEAQRSVANLDKAADARMAVVFGFGLGYHAEALLARWGAGFEVLLVLEAREDIFWLAMRHRDLRPLLNNPKVYFQVGGEALDIFNCCFEAAIPLLTSQPVLSPHAPSMRLAPQWYELAREQLLVATRIGSWSAQTKMVTGRHAFENVLHNYLEASGIAGVNRILGRFEGLPVFVVAAGPSLDKNVETLRRVGERGVIIAVDTALRKLLAAGVRPHIVCSIDPMQLSLRHFEGVEPPAETVMLFDMENHPACRDPFPGPKGVIWVRKNRMLEAMEDALGGRGAVEKGNTVAHTAFYLARALGASPVVFVGQDLAYPREPGATHASGSAFQAQWTWANPAKTHLVQPMPGTTDQEQVVEVFWVPGSDGEPVPTIPQLYAYLRQFEVEVRKTTAPCIDATEGGALIHGTQVMPLAEVIDRYCVREGEVTRFLLDEMGAPPNDEEAARAYLRQLIDDLAQGRDNLRKGLRLVERARDQLRDKSTGEPAVHQAVEAVTQLHLATFANVNVNLSVEQVQAAAVLQFMTSRPRSDRTPDRAFWLDEMARHEHLFEASIGALDYVGRLIRGILDKNAPPPEEA